MHRTDDIIFAKLPADLKTWRGPSGLDRHYEPTEAIWKLLEPFFAERGYTLWQHRDFFMTAVSRGGSVSNRFMYATPHRAYEKLSGSILKVLSFEYQVSSLDRLQPAHKSH